MILIAYNSKKCIGVSPNSRFLQVKTSKIMFSLMVDACNNLEVDSRQVQKMQDVY